MSEYGPEVWCDESGQPEPTHRPAGSKDPWWCMMCGATDHAVVEKVEES